MFKYLLQGEEINWMAVFALVTFFAMFFISLLVVWRRNPAFIEKMSHLPLEDGNESANS